MTKRALITTLVAIAPMAASAAADAQSVYTFTAPAVPVAPVAAPAPAVPTVAFAAPGVFSYDVARSFATRAPAAWQEQDPAVSLYRTGRTQLNDGDFRKAAETFGTIYTKYPRSTYAPDAYYWRGFALYKAEDYTAARGVLREQQSKFPKAATAKDGAALLAQVNGRLAARGDAGSAEVITSKASKVAQGCGDVDEKVAVMNSFLGMDAERALPLLKQILNRRDACSVELRRKAVFLVSQKRSAETEDLLLSAARSDPDREVKQQAVFWLSQVNSERALGMLEDILKTSSDNEIRDKAVFAISQHRSERAGEILRSYAGNASAPDEIREKAIFWIGQRRSGDNTAFLKQLYGRETNQELKDKIIFSLSQQPGNQTWLMDVATDGNQPVEMRKKALFWAGQSKETSLVELSGLYDKMGNREMKEQLIFVYSQRREPAAVDKLMAIARSEQDRELRKKAIFWLGQSKDPRAADFLMKMISE